MKPDRFRQLLDESNRKAAGTKAVKIREREKPETSEPEGKKPDLTERDAEMIGRTFGKLTVLNFAGNGKFGHQFLCKCECGRTVIKYRNALLMGKVKSCGCLKRELGAAKKAARVKEVVPAEKERGGQVISKEVAFGIFDCHNRIETITGYIESISRIEGGYAPKLYIPREALGYPGVRDECVQVELNVDDAVTLLGMVLKRLKARLAELDAMAKGTADALPPAEYFTVDKC